MIRIKKINKLIYANASTNLILINLHTQFFPIAIESREDKMVVAFTGDDFHARNLRNNNHTILDENKKI